jgi:hypothetical protein
MIQRHPVDSFKEKVNFWEEFADYKINKVFGAFWRINKKAGLKYLEASSKFMWLLTLCYDRKSSFFIQPDIDKWEVIGYTLFGKGSIMVDLLEDIKCTSKFLHFTGLDLIEYIAEFERTIDIPIGLSLRILEKKLNQRTAFIDKTEYSMDYYDDKKILRKGTADQLDRMFANTEKINGLILKAMENLKTAERKETAKGGGEVSLSDGDINF